MCVAGGKRCEYSDALANVRRKVKSKLKDKDGYEVAREVTNEVRRFQEQNPEMVAAHLPGTMGFQAKAPSWDVPASLLEKMGDRKETVLGAGEQGYNEFFANLYSRKEQWFASLDKDEDNAVHAYTMDAFEPINLHLRRRGFTDWAKKHAYLYSDLAGKDAYLDKFVKPRIAGMDSALTKLPPMDEPEKLYRFFRVPAGVNPRDYIKRYMRTGTGFKDRGFLSASADPEYVAAHIMDRSPSQRNKGYVVLEMLTKSGASLQPSDEPYWGHVQSLEAEVLLPRNTAMRIVETGSRRFEFNKDRNDLASRFHSWGNKTLDLSKGVGLNLPVVRMIDESLIRETRKNEA